MAIGLGVPIGGTSGTPHPATYDGIDSILRWILQAVERTPGTDLPFTETMIQSICHSAREVISRQPMLLELNAPVIICGDVHGQFYDLLHVFRTMGFPGTKSYLFLGDYVDRGRNGIETICLLLAYKIKYPENVFLLRGNHECPAITKRYGFYDECKRRYNIPMWRRFMDVFNMLPVAAVIAKSILCMHGGISPSLSHLDELKNIQRPTTIFANPLLIDLTWSDPEDRISGYGVNVARGISYAFGSDALRDCMNKLNRQPDVNIQVIVRAHQVVEDGYELCFKRTCLTLFSAPNYTGKFDNKAAVASVAEDLRISITILKPTKGRLVINR